MKKIKISENFIEGAISFEKQGGLIKPWRLPFQQIKLFAPSEELRQRAEEPAGIRLRFRTDSTTITLFIVPVETEEARIFDIVVNGNLHESKKLEKGQSSITFSKLSKGIKIIEVWLSQKYPVTLNYLMIDESSTLEPIKDKRINWITYGSSITHCKTAHSPSRTWPAIVARKHNFNLTCLGYGGNCHIEPMIAMMIRDLPADIVTLKIGINVMGHLSLSPRTFKPAIIGFVKIIREKLSNIPIFVISPISSPPRETVLNSVGFFLEKIRTEIEEAVTIMKSYGDDNIYYISGLELFDKDLADKYLPDLLHPNGEGYEIIGANFSNKIISKFRDIC